MGWPRRKWFTQVYDVKKKGKTDKKLEKKYCGKVEVTEDLISNPCNMEYC
jgi:hypothetical protein